MQFGGEEPAAFKPLSKPTGGRTAKEHFHMRRANGRNKGSE
jgi:hypothetical protein